MAAAWEAPVFHVTTSVEIEAADARRHQVTAASLSDELVRCCALSLARHPALNAHFKDDAVHLLKDVNIGLAVALDDGLIVPVIKDVTSLALGEIADHRQDVVGRARSRTLTSADVAGGTFTISNLGMFGIDQFDALLNLPQVAILAVGAARSRLVIERREVAERRFVDLTITVDHRAVDGASAAMFMQTLKGVIERGSLPPLESSGD